MANPFGDFDDEALDMSTSQPKQHQSSASLNPFGDFDDQDNEIVNENSKKTDQLGLLDSPLDDTNPFKEDVEADLKDPFGNISPIKPPPPSVIISSSPRMPTTKMGDTSGFGSAATLADYSTIVEKKRQQQQQQQPQQQSYLDFDQDSNIDSRSVASSGSAGGDNVSYYSLGDGSLQKEGLLCPDCLEEFRTITELIAHSEREHSSSSGQAASPSSFFFGANSTLEAGLSGQMSMQIKGLLRNLLKQNADTEDAEALAEAAKVEDARNQSHDQIRDWKLYMRTGVTRAHMNDFRRAREIKIEGHIYETNKLIIRLDRLLRNYPPTTEPVARREHEMSIVEWIDESIVSLCPNCAGKFNFLLLKKHHCRLCGSVMCSKCSEFIDVDYAYRLVNPVGLDSTRGSWGGYQTTRPPIAESGNYQPISATTTMNAMLAAIASPLKAAVDSSAIGGDAPAGGRDQIRLCLHCYALLEMRTEKLNDAHFKASIETIYTRLREVTNEMNQLLPIYYKMVDSLYLGETTYNLKDAIELRQKLNKLGEQADLISRKIEKLDLDTEEHVPQRRIKIQQSIRRAIVAFLREFLVALPELPNETALEQLRARHAEIIAARVAYEKELTLKEQRLLEARDKEKRPVISLEEGFSLANPAALDHTLSELEDPIVLQMNIIQSYIEAARKEHRYDEVKMLETNLKELEIEYYFNQANQTCNISDTSGFRVDESQSGK